VTELFLPPETVALRLPFGHRELQRTRVLLRTLARDIFADALSGLRIDHGDCYAEFSVALKDGQSRGLALAEFVRAFHDEFDAQLTRLEKDTP
jgi:hypothetical protein